MGLTAVKRGYVGANGGEASEAPGSHIAAGGDKAARTESSFTLDNPSRVGGNIRVEI